MRRLLLIVMLSLPVAAQSSVGKLAIYDEWTGCVETLKPEWIEGGLWHRLRDSLIHDPPEHVKSLDRLAIYDELIALHEKRLAALKKMKEIEKR